MQEGEWRVALDNNLFVIRTVDFNAVVSSMLSVKV